MCMLYGLCRRTENSQPLPNLNEIQKTCFTVRHEILARIIFGVFFKCTRLAEEILANFNDTQYVLLDVFYVV